MKLVLTVLLSTMLINCGGSSTTEPLNADSVNTDGDNNTPEVSALDTLKASNCGQSPDTVKPFYLVVDPYLNSSPLSQNYRLPGTPLISKRCLNSGCEEYSYDSINNMVEVIGTYQPEISKKIYTYNPDNTINVVTTYYADLLSAIDTYTYDNSRLTKTFLDMYNNGIESGIDLLISYEYHDNSGLLSRLTRSSIRDGVADGGSYDDYIYCDNNNLLIHESGTLSHGIHSVSTYEYNEIGNRIKRTVTGNSPSIISYEYNDQNQLFKALHDGLGSFEMDGVIDAETTYEYDEYGSLLRQTHYYPQLGVFEAGLVFSYTYIL